MPVIPRSCSCPRKLRYSFEHAVLSFKVCLRLACSADQCLSTVFLPAARIFAFQAGQPDCLWGLSKLLLQVVETLVSYVDCRVQVCVGAEPATGALEL